MPSSSPKNEKSAPHYAWVPLVSGLCFGLAGAAYGGFLHFNPDYKEDLIREKLSVPHMDSARYLASAQAIRYQGFGEIVVRKAATPLILGVVLGMGASVVLGHLKHQEMAGVAEKAEPRRLTLIEFLVVLLIVGSLVEILPVAGTGLVFYEGKDQFYWIERLEFGPASEREATIDALCALLEGKPFLCRTTIIPAIAKCGDDAKTAIPVLEKLASDSENSVSKAATEALADLSTDDQENSGKMR